jgi:plasmid stabilization system protein ParE
VVTEGAARGLERCREFLAARNPAASRRAAQAIGKQFAVLATHPGIGRPMEDEPGMRELVVAFGDSGYVALYHHDKASDSVLILAFRHQKEAGYT